jgi:hypothetical protein
MRRAILVGVAAFTLATIASGCMSRNCVRCGNGPTQGATGDLGQVIASRPATAQPDVSALASREMAQLWQQDALAGGSYRLLKAGDVQCRAAACCGLANALASESQKIACEKELKQSKQRSAETKSQVLLYRAAEERNKASAQALQAFYLLAEAEFNRDVARQGKEKIEAMLDEVKNLEGQGIRVEKGSTELQRQRLDAADHQAQVRLAVAQTNSQLRQLLGLCPDDPMPIWPDVDWKVTADAIDHAAAVSLGLCHRADVNMLRMLAQSPDDDSLGGAAGGLSAMPGLPAGGGAASVLTLCKHDDSQSRESQLNEVRTHKQRDASEEIHRAACEVEARCWQISVAKMQVDRCQEQIRSLRLQRQRPNSTTTTLDIGAAELQLLDAQRELVHQVIAWRIAQVKLKESQGLLAFECGLGCG